MSYQPFHSTAIEISYELPWFARWKVYLDGRRVAKGWCRDKPGRAETRANNALTLAICKADAEGEPRDHP